MKTKAKKTAAPAKVTPGKMATASKPVAPPKIRKSTAKPLTNTDPFRKKLEALRDDLLKVINKKKEEVPPMDESVGDEGDVAIRSLERDLVFEQTGTELRLLEEVEAALRRIEKNIFGICEANGEKIGMDRLKAIPYARYCINCQSRFDHI